MFDRGTGGINVLLPLSFLIHSTMSFSVGDNSTVVGDATVRKDPREDLFLKEEPRGGKAKQKSVNDFVTADDYTLEDRPFFVTIGKDGLIGALQKLDKQLVDVRISCTISCSLSPSLMFFTV